MKVERIERVTLAVKNLDEAERFFSDLLGIKFHRTTEKVQRGEIARKRRLTEHTSPSRRELQRRPAYSREGLELIEGTPPFEKEGMVSCCIKVSNLEEAKAEMKEKGIRLLEEIELGNLKEAIFSADDLHGIGLVLTEFEAPDAISAVLGQK